MLAAKEAKAWRRAAEPQNARSGDRARRPEPDSAGGTGTARRGRHPELSLAGWLLPQAAGAAHGA